MSKGCFCHFNGYEVKDAKARKDITDLETKVYRDIQPIDDTSKEALAIAQGRARSFVFDTYTDMFNALEGDNGTTYKLGDNLFIKALNVPDYWISEVLEDTSGEMGYYNVSMLETQKVDLSPYAIQEVVDDLSERLDFLEEDVEDIKSSAGVKYIHRIVYGKKTSNKESFESLLKMTLIITSNAKLNNITEILNKYIEIYGTNTSVPIEELPKFNYSGKWAGIQTCYKVEVNNNSSITIFSHKTNYNVETENTSTIIQSPSTGVTGYEEVSYIIDTL